MRRPLLNMGMLFVLGEAAYKLAEKGILYSVTSVAIGIIITIISGKSTQKKCLDLLLFLCLPLGMLWGYAYYYSEGRGVLDAAYEGDEEVQLEGYVYKLEESGSSARALLRTAEGRCYLGLSSLYSDEGDSQTVVEPGMYIRVRGRLSLFEEATNPGGYDSREYYYGRGVRYRIEPEDLNIEDRENRVVRSLYRLRRRMGQRMDRCYAEEDAAILRTILFGDKSGDYSDSKLLFQRSGIAHILAISGLHIMLIAHMLEWVLSHMRLRKKWAYIIIITVILLYGVMTGMSEATTRAIIMLVISYAAFLFKRSSDTPTSMMEALLIMMIINPGVIFSNGALMSFSAVLGVATGSAAGDMIFDKDSFARLDSKYRWRARRRAGGILVPLSINMWMLPVIMNTYYEVPVYSLLLNFIVIPALTVIIICAFLSIIMGSIAFIPAWACSRLLSLYRLLCHWFLSLPGSVYSTGHVETFHLLLIYLVMIIMLAAGYYIMTRRRREVERTLGRHWRSYAALILLGSYLVVGAGSMLSVRLYNVTQSRVVFLDVGQGDGSIIHHADGLRGRNYIIDCGSSSRESVGEYTLIPALKYYGMTDIDCIFLSHMDADHINGATYLLENQEKYGIRVRAVAISRGTELGEMGGSFETVTQLVEAGSNTGITAEPVKSGGSGGTTEEPMESGGSGGTRVEPVGSEGSGGATVEPVGSGGSGGAMAEPVESGGSGGAMAEPVESGGSTGVASSRQNEGGSSTPLKQNGLMLKSGTLIYELGEGDVVDGLFTVLYPTGEEEIKHSGNDYSLVLEYKTDRVEILYTGDISSTVEEKLVSKLEKEAEGEKLVNKSDKETEGEKLVNKSDKETEGEKLVNKSNKETEGEKLVNKSDKETEGEKQVNKLEKETEGERLVGKLEKETEGDIRILKCAHHGSKYSSCEDFLSAYSPDITVISCGKNNMYGHPAPDTLSRLKSCGCDIYRTDQSGALIIEGE